MIIQDDTQVKQFKNYEHSFKNQNFKTVSTFCATIMFRNCPPLN